MRLTPEPVDMRHFASIRCCVVLIFAEAGGFDTERDGSCSETAGAIGRTGIGGIGTLPPISTFAGGRGPSGVDGMRPPSIAPTPTFLGCTTPLVPDEVGGKIN